MKIIVTKHETSIELSIIGSNGSLNQFAFKNDAELHTFMEGFRCARELANRAIQCLPDSYTTEKSHKS